MIEVLTGKPTQKNIEFQKYWTEVQVLNTTAIVSGYAGRDPQEENSNGSFL